MSHTQATVGEAAVPLTDGFGGGVLARDSECGSSDGLLVIWNLGDFTHYELFFELANGYVHAARAVFQEQLQAASRDYFKLLPGMFGVVHGIECYLKGAVLLGDSSATVKQLSKRSVGHNLKNLYGKYRGIWRQPQFRLPIRAEEYIEWSASAPLRVAGVFERYLFDKDGRLLKERGSDTLLLDETLDLIGELAQTFQGLEVEMRKSRGIDRRTHPDQIYSRVANTDA